LALQPAPIWNFSTGCAGSVMSTMIVPLSSTGLPGFSDRALPCVPTNAITLPFGYWMKYGGKQGALQIRVSHPACLSVRRLADGQRTAGAACRDRQTNGYRYCGTA
jgi:hypothetical protein